jgi:hypothetical protein
MLGDLELPVIKWSKRRNVSISGQADEKVMAFAEQLA